MTRLIRHSGDPPSEEENGQLEGKFSKGLHGQKNFPGSSLMVLENPHQRVPSSFRS